MDQVVASLAAADDEVAPGVDADGGFVRVAAYDWVEVGMLVGFEGGFFGVWVEV